MILINQCFQNMHVYLCIMHKDRGKETLEQLPYEHFLQVSEISRTFLRAKWVGEKPSKNHSQGCCSIFSSPLRQYKKSSMESSRVKMYITVHSVTINGVLSMIGT